MGCKEQLLKASAHTLVIDISFSSDKNDDMNEKYVKLGLILLDLGVFCDRKNAKILSWNTTLVQQIKTSKKSILQELESLSILTQTTVIMYMAKIRRINLMAIFLLIYIEITNKGCKEANNYDNI